MRDAVRLVVEEPRVVLVEVVQRRRLEDIRVDLRDAVDAVAADDREARHVHHAVLDDGERMHLVLVLRVACAHVEEPAAVDLVDDHVDARQKRLEHVDRPLLKRLRHDRVVRVRHRVLRDRPRLVPLEALLIDEDAHELRDAERGMRVVDVDGDFLREVVQVHARLLEMAHDALHAGRDEEILLDEAHAAAVVRAVIRVEVLRDGLDELAVFVLLAALLLREHAVVGEVAVDLRVPEAQRVDRMVVVADDRHVVRHRHDRQRVLVDELQRAVLELLHIGIAVELDIDRLIRLAVLPGEAVLEPVVGDLDLVAVNDLLLKEAVLVADAAAVARQAVCCHRVDEAGREPAEAAVAEAGVRLLLVRLGEIDLQPFEDLFDRVLDAEVHEVRLEQAAEQKLDGEIVNLLLLAFHVSAVRLDPILRDELLRRRCNGLIDLILRQLVDLTAPHHMRGVDEPAAKRLLERLVLFVLADFPFLPCQMKHSPLAVFPRNIESRQKPCLRRPLSLDYHVFRHNQRVIRRSLEPFVLRDGNIFVTNYILDEGAVLDVAFLHDDGVLDLDILADGHAAKQDAVLHLAADDAAVCDERVLHVRRLLVLHGDLILDLRGDGVLAHEELLPDLRLQDVHVRLVVRRRRIDVRDVAVVLAGVDRVLVRAADDAVHEEVLPAVLVRVAHHLDEDLLLHEVDRERHLRAVIDDGLLRDVLDEPVVRRLEHDVLTDGLLRCSMVDHRDIRARILVETQDGIEIHIVDETAAREQHVALLAVLDVVEIVVEILEIAPALVIVSLGIREVEEPLMTAGEIPVLAGTQVVEHGARLVRQHDADIADAGIHHAR